MLYDFELDHNTTETKKISMRKREYQLRLILYSLAWFVSFTNLAKVSGAAKLCFKLLKYCKTSDSSEYVLNINN